MSNPNDQKIEALRQAIQTKEKKLVDPGRVPYETNLSLELDGARYNLNTIETPVLELLILKIYRLQTDAVTLGFETPTLSGFPTSAWLHDLQHKRATRLHTSALAKLSKLHTRLNSLLSEEARTASELEEIAKLLQ